ncbi:MAG: ketopantoate reductase family protein [bacterium]|nr:ketopantoate reductase family protein [bacterium]
MEPVAYNEGLSIAVLGPGAVGGFLAALLAKAGERVTVIGREPAVDRIKNDGITVQSALFGDFLARPEAQTRLSAPVGVLFVTAKAGGLSESLHRIEPARVGRAVVVPLLNGIEHMETLRRRFPGRVAAGTISIEALRLDSGTIAQRSPFVKIRLASDARTLQPRLEGLKQILRRAGIEATVETGEKAILWGKLVRLNALTLAVTASGRALGAVRDDPYWLRRLTTAATEGALVAQAEGVPVAAEEVIAELAALPGALVTSMYHDRRRGQELELDAIAGAVVRAGRRHGIPCPEIEELIDEIKRG